MLDKVKIGGLTYDVELSNDLQGRQGNWGEIEYKSTTIRLDDRLNKQVMNQTLIHEIMHGMFSEAGIEQDEHKVDVLGKVLYQVLLDNDFSWLRDKEEYEETITKEGKFEIPFMDGE